MMELNGESAYPCIQYKPYGDEVVITEPCEECRGERRIVEVKEGKEGLTLLRLCESLYWSGVDTGMDEVIRRAGVVLDTSIPQWRLDQWAREDAGE